MSIHHAVRVRVRDELTGRVDEIVHQITTAIREEIPAYAALTAAQRAENIAITEWGLTRVLQLWVEDGELSAVDVERFKGIGAARALDGRPLTGVLRAYRLAGAAIFDLVEQTGRPHLGMDDVVALARLWMQTIDTLSEALRVGHATAGTRASGDRSAAVGDLVDDLLLGREVTRTGLTDRLRELGLVLGPPVSLILVRPREATAEINLGALHAMLAAEVDAPPTSILTRVRTDLGVAIVPDPVRLDPMSLARRSWRGCRLTRLSIAELPRAFRVAVNLVARAPERAFSRGALLDEADAQVVALLSGHPDADHQALAATILDPLRLTSGDHLLDGLRAYLDAGSAAGAAALLGLHPQTVRYRLHRILELTDRDPRQAWDRLVLDAACMAATPSEPGGRPRPGRP